MKVELELSPGQTAIFGYGSLLYQTSMEQTLGYPYTKRRYLCALRGWRRTWDVMMPNRSFYEDRHGQEMTPENIVYLNISRAPGLRTNGLAYTLETEELALFDKREWIYDRITVTDQVDLKVKGGNLVVYLGKPEYMVPAKCDIEKAAIRKSYLDIVEKGLAQLGEAFRTEYLASTDTPRAELIINDKKRTGEPSLAGSRESEGGHLRK